MRLWHKDLIPVLPRQQLLGQWRECCLIAKSIEEKGAPNHLLVNPIMDYPLKHFVTYSRMVFDEMERREYNVHSSAFTKHIGEPFYRSVRNCNLFCNWHTRRYMTQCLAYLEERYDRGGITEVEWQTVLKYISIYSLKHARCV